MGDIKLLAMLAAWLGLRQTALVFFLPVVVGAAYGLLLVVANSRRKDMPLANSPFPLEHFSSCAGLLQYLSR